MSLKVVFILANSADPDEMLPNATFYLGLHCLPKYLFIVTQKEKGNYQISLFRFVSQLLYVEKLDCLLSGSGVS